MEAYSDVSETLSTALGYVGSVCGLVFGHGGCFDSYLVLGREWRYSSSAIVSIHRISDENRCICTHKFSIQWRKAY
jgi:hypothetical protein